MTTTYEWFGHYSAAVLETDWSKMEERLRAAESAVKARLHELSLNHNGTPEEHEAIKDCLNKLNVLRADVATWSASKQQLAGQQ
jgi:hypothetical protein